MKPLALAALAVLLFAAAASAMTPATAKYLSSIGIDPKSEEVVAVDKEGPVLINYGDEDDFECSLDTLAAEKRKNGISHFILTRTFIRNLKKDFDGTELQKYNSLYLTRKELGLPGKKIIALMRKKKG